MREIIIIPVLFVKKQTNTNKYDTQTTLSLKKSLLDVTVVGIVPIVALAISEF